MLRKRLLPVISGTRGRGGPWIHVSDAASATVAALYRGRPGESYNIADDQPARLNDLVEHLANAVGAPHPSTIPIWLVRPFAPFMAATWLSTSLVVSNSKAKKQLEWTPCFRATKKVSPAIAPAIDAVVQSRQSLEKSVSLGPPRPASSRGSITHASSTPFAKLNPSPPSASASRNTPNPGETI